MLVHLLVCFYFCVIDPDCVRARKSTVTLRDSCKKKKIIIVDVSHLFLL